MIQSGSSFACAHITRLIAKIIQGKKLDVKDLLNELREEATAVYQSRTYKENAPEFTIKRAVCFPYNKEIDTLCRNEALLTFKLIGVYDSKYNFNLGKTIILGKIIKQIGMKTSI